MLGESLPLERKRRVSAKALSRKNELNTKEKQITRRGKAGKEIILEGRRREH